MNSLRMHIVLICFLAIPISSLPLSPQDGTGPALANHDPEAAVILTADIDLFWRAYDRWIKELNGDPKRLADVLQREYIERGSQGVKDFIPKRIASAENLAGTLLANRSYYEGVRHNTELVQASAPEFRKDFGEFKKLYPDAIFPSVFFVIGALTSGGTSTGHGLIIGTEMLSDKNPLNPTTDAVAYVMHELIHFQQKHSDNTLLASCLLEGAADFVSELVIGRNINERNKAYGDSHEEELWQKFQDDIKRTDKKDNWLFNYGKRDRAGPPDLGYYIGYKICQSFYQISIDKAAALRVIVEMRDPDKLLEMSRYGARFSTSRKSQ